MNQKRVWLALIGAIAFSACDGAEEAGQRQAAARDTAAVAAAHDMHAMRDTLRADSAAPMAGMDHGAMGGARPTDGTAGMDHAKMGGAGQPPDAMAGMDHAAMAGRAQQPAGMAAMDHARMEAPGARAARTAGMPGVVDHAAMPGMDRAALRTPPAADTMHDMPHTGMDMLPSGAAAASSALVERMLADPVIRERLATDPVVQRVLLQLLGGLPAEPMPGMDHSGMAGMQPPAAGVMRPPDNGLQKLRALAAELLRDPAVQARIQVDSTLRAGWSNEGVRRVLSPDTAPAAAGVRHEH